MEKFRGSVFWGRVLWRVREGDVPLHVGMTCIDSTAGEALHRQVVANAYAKRVDASGHSCGVLAFQGELATARPKR